MATPPKEIRVWREILLEISLRALKKVQLSHTPWALNKLDVKGDDILKLNQNAGVLFAYETTVAAEISNEFIYSMFTNGLTIDKETRHYEVLREITFRLNDEKSEPFRAKGKDDKGNPNKQSSTKVDLYVRRRDFKEPAKDKSYLPVFIELKRYENVTFDISTGDIDKITSNSEDIARDIYNLRKLRQLISSLKYVHEFPELGTTNKFTQCLIYQLVWGKCSSTESSKKKQQLSSEFGIGEKDVHFRWLPLLYADKEVTEVKEWLWVALLEIAPPAQIKGSAY